VKLEIGRILHLKSEIRNRKLDSNSSVALEPRKPVWIIGEMVRKELESDVALQLRIAHTKDDTHPSSSGEPVESATLST